MVAWSLGRLVFLSLGLFGVVVSSGRFSSGLFFGVVFLDPKNWGGVDNSIDRGL